MDFNSKKISLSALAVTAILLSRTTFSVFSDAYGPRLPVIIGFIFVLYFSSLAAYLFNLEGSKNFYLGVCIQVVLVAGVSILEGLRF